jgi:hypothetical protein
MRYRIGCFIVVFILTTSQAPAQKSTALVRADVMGQYQVIKRSFEKGAGRQETLDPKESYDLTNCFYTDPSIYTKNGLTRELVGLAADAGYISITLDWAGYPRSLWKPLLDTYEREQLSLLASRRPMVKRYDDGGTQRFGTLLLQQLQNYRERSATPLPSIYWTSIDGCGGAGRNIKIKTSPSRGHVRLMPAFYYDLCKAQQIEADDPNKCDHGTEIADGEDMLVSGVYRYFAVWPNGLKKQGRQDFDALSENIESWTIRYSAR